MNVRRAVLALGCCLAALFSASESRAVSVVVDEKPNAADANLDRFRFEVGPTFSMPLPTASANRDVPGLDAGLQVTMMQDRYFGLGAGFAYHYWPVSTEFKEGFSQLLRNGTLNILELGGSTWDLNVYQWTLHFKGVARNRSAVTPWLQPGVGSYRVDPNVSGYSGDAGFFSVKAGPLPPKTFFGYYVAAGTDVRVGPHASLGIFGIYHRVGTKKDLGADLEVFSLGVHAPFGN